MKEEDKIKNSEYFQFALDYYNGGARTDGIRMGQHFMNTMFPNVTDPDVFYADCADAQNLILTKYVRGNE